MTELSGFIYWVMEIREGIGFNVFGSWSICNHEIKPSEVEGPPG